MDGLFTGVFLFELDANGMLALSVLAYDLLPVSKWILAWGYETFFS